MTRAALLGALIASSSAYANLITVNPGFETPLVNGPNAASGYAYRFTGDAGWGWATGSRGAVQFNSTYAPGNVQGVGDGNQSEHLELAGDYIEQTIGLTIGQNYSLSFLLASYQPPGTSSLKVSISGVGDSFLAGGSSWAAQSLSFTAAVASTAIRFTNNNTSGVFTYPHLDKISLDPASVPAPATLALVGTGLVALAWSRRRRVAAAAQAES